MNKRALLRRRLLSRSRSSGKASVLPLAVLFGPDALRYRLEDSGALVLITSAESHARCRERFGRHDRHLGRV